MCLKDPRLDCGKVNSEEVKIKQLIRKREVTSEGILLIWNPSDEDKKGGGLASDGARFSGFNCQESFDLLALIGSGKQSNTNAALTGPPIGQFLFGPVRAESDVFDDGEEHFNTWERPRKRKSNQNKLNWTFFSITASTQQGGNLSSGFLLNYLKPLKGFMVALNFHF